MTLIELINADFYPSSLLACPDSYREGVVGYLFATNTSYHRVTNAKPSAPRCKRGAVLHSFMPAFQASNTSNHNSQGMFAFISAHQHNQRHLRSIPSQFRPFNKSFSIVNFQFSIN